MSGIAGIVGDVEDIEYRLATMLRGKGRCTQEGGGFWVSEFIEGRLGFACCSSRVSELEESVRQPYVDEDTRLVIMLDGDVYNYRELRTELQSSYVFSTDSSVEVLSKAYREWGNGFVKRLQGAFSIVIYDKLNYEVLMFRDSFGIKPFYYTTHRGALFFASEVRSIFASGVHRSISIERWASYMLYSTYGPDYSTFWENVYQLQAGSLLRYNGYSLSYERWYNLQDDIDSCIGADNLLEAGRELVDRLERQAELSMSDVSCCGMRIAGRVESRLLHTIAVGGQQRWKVKAFVGELWDGGERHSDVTSVSITEDGAVGELEQMAQWVEEPFDGLETLWRILLFRRAQHDGVRLLCSGLGLDVMWQDEWDVGGLRYNYSVRHDIFSPYLTQFATRPCYDIHSGVVSGDGRYCDLFYERMPHILRVIERSSAHVGVAVRMPFLDHNLVALSYALPERLKRVRRGVFEECVLPRYDYKSELPVGVERCAMRMSGVLKEWVNDAMSDLCRGVVREWFNVIPMERLREQVNAAEEYDCTLLWKCISLHRLLSMTVIQSVSRC